ncbi:MAG: dipeptide ABC transporter ATP-binding protein [Thiofilum sp.]|uniref:dipeptide ABC transporter ATP-binding protein n=1 Tax=Thiofilum sp. TaxID=2212733 RepID=UPI0025E54319|nr:dipeptide ABC transporter ATP-binding protein [Thiofilum sp.]MBK8454484.1 dipeptide ABC transporter ATP-binding protein [Thiofilum sp.]
MSEVLRAQQLCRYYSVSQGLTQPKAIVRALNGVSFSLQAGETLAIVGESGCGKSTLARALTLIETPTAGELWIDGKAVNFSQKPSAELRRTIQIVFQNPYGSLNPRQTIQQMLDEPLLLNTHMSKLERRQAVATMLERVGLRPEYAERYPHMFSGGQRQRIAIARALMLKPKIVVLDEPVSALDLSVRAQILNLLTELQQELGLAYVFISHDLSVVERIADQVVVMYFGRVVEHAPKATIFAHPQHPYTQALFSATPQARVGEKRERIHLQGEPPSPLKPPTGCAFNPRCRFTQKLCTEQLPEFREVQGSQVACHLAPLG